MATDEFRIDSHKLMYHPQRVAALLEGRDDWERARTIYPIYLEISPVGACNHRCVFCSVDFVGYKRVTLPLDTLRRELPEMGRRGVKAIMYAGEGEPLLHPDISEITRLTKQAGIDVSFTTNASVLPKDFIETALPHVSWLKASIGAGTAETYAQIHRVKPQMFDTVIANLSALATAKRAAGLAVTLGAQILLLPENVEEIETLARICRDEIGLDYLVVKPYSQNERSLTRTYAELDYSLEAEQAARYESLNSERFRLVYRGNTMRKYNAHDRYPHCLSVPFLWGYVMANGTVSGCSAFLLDPRFELGDLNTTSFAAIWEGDRRRALWETIRGAFDISACRRNCRMDEVNRYLYALIDAPPPHVNFI